MIARLVLHRERPLVRLSKVAILLPVVVLDRARLVVVLSLRVSRGEWIIAGGLLSNFASGVLSLGFPARAHTNGLVRSSHLPDFALLL